MSPRTDEELPRELLDAWEVPEMPGDLEERIMTAIPPSTAPSTSSRNPMTLIVPLLAGLAAAMLVIVFLGLIRSPDEPEPTAPVPVTAPPVADPAPAPAVAPAPAPAPRSPSNAATAATLVLDIVPDSASVLVDGKAVAGPSPFVATALAPGRHRLEVTAAGRLPVERTLDLPAGTTKLPLTLGARHVTVIVNTEPKHADLVLHTSPSAGKATKRDVASPVEIDRLDEGVYQIEASARGYESRIVELAFDGSPTAEVSIVLPKDPDAADPRPERDPAPKARSATLKIGTNHGTAPARVYVDGKFIGTTPIVNMPVTPGRHTIKWRWSTGKQVSQNVTIEADQVKVVKAG